MPVTTTLIEDGRIFVVIIVDPWTVAELAKGEEVDKATRDASPFAKVHCLIDMREARKMPPGAILTGRRTPSMNHRTAGHITIVGANSFVRTIAETVFKMAHYSRLKFSTTYEEGLNFLRGAIKDEDAARV